jgi:hypothetical protein
MSLASPTGFELQNEFSSWRERLCLLDRLPMGDPFKPFYRGLAVGQKKAEISGSRTKMTTLNTGITCPADYFPWLSWTLT